MDPTLWLAFFAASWAISLSPGAGAVAAMSAGVQCGFVRGYFFSYGLVLGLWTQLLIVAIGLGALITSSAAAFALLKWLGVAYLLGLGVAQWRSSSLAMRAPGVAAGLPSRHAIVLRGWALNTVNPKGTLFMLAVVPQFLDPARPLLSQYLVIAATLAFTDLIVNAGYTAFATRALRAMRSPRQACWLQRGFGSVTIGLAVGLPLFRRGN